MAYIYVGFSTPKKFSLVSTIIKLWQGVDYSHVYLRFESSNKYVPSSVYQATADKVNFKSFENFSKDSIVIEELKVEVTDVERSMILGDCIGLAGASYGYLEILKIVINDILYKLCKKTVSFKDAPDGYICSELVATLLIHGLNYRFEKPLYLLKPIDIYKTLSKKDKEIP